MSAAAINVGAINVGSVIDNAPTGRFHYEIIGICGLIAMLDGFDTQSIAFVAPVLAKEWGLSAGVFGSIFGAGLFGIMVGQVLLGPLADKFGRRTVIILCTLLFGILTLCTVLVTDWETLLVLRFLTGIGLGGATPNIISLTSEFSPSRARATMITVMFGGFPFGAAVGGYISSFMIPAYGWQSVFYLGGVIPLLLVVLIALRLPESVQYMVAKNMAREKIAAILNSINPATRISADTMFHLPEQKLDKVGLAYFFSDGRTLKTLLIWLTYFTSLLMIYFLMSWLPSVLKEAGLSIGNAIISAVFLNLGGMIGGIALGRMLDKANPFVVLATAYFIAGTCIASIGLVSGSFSILMIAVFAAGFFIIGGQTALNATAAAIYPTQVRSSGIGFALGVGRIGSIVGPVAGGYLLATGLPTTTLFWFAALPAIVACLALLVIRALLNQPATPPAAA